MDESAETSLPESLRKRHQEAVERAKEYSDAGGDPVDDLQQLFDEIVVDEQIWQDVLEDRDNCG